jgi:hypothetical protein
MPLSTPQIGFQRRPYVEGAGKGGQSGTDANQQSRLARRRRRKYLANLVARQWCQFAAHRLRAYRHWRRAQLLAATSAMQLHARAGARAAAVAKAFSWKQAYRHLGRIVHAWYTISQELKVVAYATDAVAQVRCESSSSIQRCVLQLWSDQATEKYMQQRRHAQAVIFHDLWVSSGAFHALSRHVKHRQDQAYHLAQARVHWWRCTARSVLHVWHHHTVWQRAVRLRICEAHQLRSSRVQHRTFSAWMQQGQLQAAGRAHACAKLAAFATRWLRAWTQQLFRAWQMHEKAVRLTVVLQQNMRSACIHNLRCGVIHACDHLPACCIADLPSEIAACRLGNHALPETHVPLLQVARTACIHCETAAWCAQMQRVGPDHFVPKPVHQVARAC